MVSHASPKSPRRIDADAKISRAKSGEAPERSAQELLHELQAHQIELEIQNEALRRSQIALEESRDRYLNLYEFAPVGYLTLNASGLIEEINLTGAALLGANRGELLQGRFAHFVGSDDRDKWHRHFMHAFGHEGKQTCELSLQRSDGGLFAACLDCLLTTTGNAAPTLRIALADISERKQIERKLRGMAQFPEENPNPVLRIGRQGDLLYANAASRRLLGAFGGARNEAWTALRMLANIAFGQDHVAETEIVNIEGHAFWIGAVRPKGEDYVNVYARDITGRWRAEKALQESEARFRTMADAAPALIWMAGVDKGCTWFNQQWLKFTGRTMAQEVGDGWAKSVHGIDLERCRRIYGDAFDRRERFEMEYRLRRADGKYRWVLDRGVPRYGVDQEFLGYIGSCVDITRLKRAEEDLNRAQSVGNIGNWRFDLLGQRFIGSRETQRIFGVRDGMPLSYEGFLGLVHPDDAEFVDWMWRSWLRGEPCDIEHRLLVDGQVKWVRSKGEHEFDAQGTLRGGFGITQDITEIKQTRQALADSQERFHAFMTNSPVASWIVDADARFLYASPILQEIIGIASADLVGKRIGEVYPPALAEKYLLGNQAAIDAWRPIKTVEPSLFADGSAGEFLVVRFPIRDTSGQTLICGMALDITERMQTVAQLRDANDRLERLAAEQAAHLRELAGELTRTEQRERDRFYELLHDGMQPLLVAARLSLSSLSARTPAGDCLRVSAEACAHIGRVIQAARTLSLQLSPPLIRERGLNPALESLCRWVKENHGIEVDLTCAPEAEPEDVAMRLLCFNAVRELLMNVAKHGAVDSATLAVQLAGGDILRITVADRGNGFDPAVVCGGSGLAGIERRLGMFGGSLEIDSRPGQGTVAKILAPLRPDAASVSATGNRPPAPRTTTPN